MGENLIKTNEKFLMFGRDLNDVWKEYKHQTIQQRKKKASLSMVVKRILYCADMAAWMLVDPFNRIESNRTRFGYYSIIFILIREMLAIYLLLLLCIINGTLKKNLFNFVQFDGIPPSLTLTLYVKKEFSLFL